MLHIREALLNGFLFSFVWATVRYVKHDEGKRIVVAGQLLGVMEGRSGAGRKIGRNENFMDSIHRFLIFLAR